MSSHLSQIIGVNAVQTLSRTYSLQPESQLMSHYDSRTTFCRDIDTSDRSDDSDVSARLRPNNHAAVKLSSESELLLRARIKSGDYFITLSTEVDKIAENLQDVGNPDSYGLQLISTELMYLHDKYEICKKF